MTDTIEVPRELLEKWADKLEGSDSAGYGWEDLLASELRALLAQPASVPDEVRRDAERYRFLMRELGGSVAQVIMGSPCFSDEDVSAAIDDALRGKDGELHAKEKPGT